MSTQVSLFGPKISNVEPIRPVSTYNIYLWPKISMFDPQRYTHGHPRDNTSSNCSSFGRKARRIRSAALISYNFPSIWFDIFEISLKSIEVTCFFTIKVTLHTYFPNPNHTYIQIFVTYICVDPRYPFDSRNVLLFIFVLKY